MLNIKRTETMAVTLRFLLVLTGIPLGKVVSALSVTSDPWATIGTDATATCSGVGSFTSIQWRRSPPDVTDVASTNVILEYRGYTTIYGTGVDARHYSFRVSGGSYVLTVKSVTVDDGAKYWCQIIEFPPNPHTDDAGSSLIEIRVPPSSIAITYDGASYGAGASIPVVAADHCVFICYTLGVNPAASFVWTLTAANSTDRPLEVRADSLVGDDSRLVDSSSTANINIPETPPSPKLTCGATNRQDGSTEAEVDITVTLQVKVPPKASQMTILDGAGQYPINGTTHVNEGSQHTFTCEVLGTRPPVIITWFLDGELQSAGVEATYTMHGSDLYDTTATWSFVPARGHHGQQVKCSASTAESQVPPPYVMITLEVYGPPDAPAITGDTSMTENEPTTLNCTAVFGYPDDWSLVWSSGSVTFNTSRTPAFYSSKDRFMFTSALEFTPTRTDNNANITCAAQRGEWTPSRVGIWGPIDVKFCARTVSVANCPIIAVAGKNVSLTCLSGSSNPATALTWSSEDGTNLTSSSDQPNIGGDYGGRVTTHTYTTGVLNVSNTGDVFQCCATNPSSSDCAEENPCDSCSLNVQRLAELTLTSDSWATINTDTTLICFGKETDSSSLASLTWLRSPSDVTDVHSATQLVKFANGEIGYGHGIDVSHYDFQASDGVFVLTVKSVTLDDGGRYWCDVIEFPQNPVTEDTASSVTRIRVPPRTIEIAHDGVSYQEGAAIAVVAGVGHRFICNAPGVTPTVNFTWILTEDNTTTLLSGSDGAPSISDDSRLVDSFGEVTVRVPDSPATSQLTCGATNRQDGLTEAEVDITVTLHVKVPPRALTLSDDSGALNPGTLVHVNQGSAHNFTCAALGTRPAATIDWFLNGAHQHTANQSTAQEKGDGLVDTTDTWMFTPARHNHRQEVECVASTAESKEPFPAVMVVLDVHGPPDSPVITGNTSMTEDVTTNLTCRADMGYPGDWSLVWSVGDAAQSDTQTTASASGDRFRFESTLALAPERDYNGKSITCLAKRGSWAAAPSFIGPIGVKFCAGSVSVADSPTAALTGSAASLSCISGSSKPASTLVWSKDGVDLTNPSHPVETDGDYGGRMTRLDFTTGILTRSNNGDVFRCCATNPVLTCTEGLCNSYTLNVEYVPVFISPTMPSTKAVQENGTLILTCKADANPKPENFISWEKLESETWEQVDSSDALSSVNSDGVSSLNLTGIVRQQAGRYRCKADNGLQQDEYSKYSSSVTIVVQYEARIMNGAHSPLRVKNGTDAVLPCIAEGNPAPTMKWYSPINTTVANDVNPEKLSAESTITGGDGIRGFEVSSHLTIKALSSQDDYGVYTCTSSNGIGEEDSLRITLIQTQIPSTPTDVEITDRTSSALVVTWEPEYDGGEDQWFYVSHVQTLETPEMETFSGRITGGMYTYTLIGLHPSTEYEVRVYAENSVGRNTEYSNATGTTLMEHVTTRPPSERFTQISTVGIIVGAVIGFGLLASVVVLEIFLRRKLCRRTKETNATLAPNGGYEISIEEFQGQIELSSYQVPTETDCPHSSGKEQESSLYGDMTDSDDSDFSHDEELLDLEAGSMKDECPPYEQRESDVLGQYQDVPGTECPPYEQRESDVLGQYQDVPEEFKRYSKRSLDMPKQNIYQDISELGITYGNVPHANKAFPRSQLNIIKELGQGAFTRVLLADAAGIMERSKVMLVAVKTLKVEASPSDKAVMMQELDVMKTLPDHPNVIKLLGFCTKQDPPYIILEFVSKGSLKDVLLYSRPYSGLMYGNLHGSSKSLSSRDFLRFAKDVADGMDFISSQQCIHRDLAARNVLVAEDMTCKVSDFGLARDVMSSRVYERRTACRLPIRWMAIETILDDVYTTKSDVWSYGVLLWEIVTLGARPYPDMGHTTMINKLNRGYRMPRPQHCTEKLYHMMLKCWRVDPETRPSFTKISDKLQRLMRVRKECISVKDFEEHIYEVRVPIDGREKV